MKYTAQQRAEGMLMYHRILALKEEWCRIPPERPETSVLRQNFIERHKDEINRYKVKNEYYFSETDDNEQKIGMLEALIQLEQFLSEGQSVDFKRYIQMGLRIKPKEPLYNENMACYLSKAQEKSGKHPTEWDYSFINNFQIAHDNAPNPEEKERHLHGLQYAEAFRDYFTGPIREINNLVQLDKRPCDLKEARCEIFKISISFKYERK